MVWEKLLPSLTCSLIWARIFLSCGWEVCAIRVVSDCTRGSPAPSRVASCRVMTVISREPALPKNPPACRFRRLSFFFPEDSWSSIR